VRGKDGEGWDDCGRAWCGTMVMERLRCPEWGICEEEGEVKVRDGARGREGVG